MSRLGRIFSAAGLALAVNAAAQGGWTFSSSLTDSPTLNDVYFVNDSFGWAVGQNGAIYRTTNGGGFWLKSTSNTQAALHAVQFLNVDTGYAVGEIASASQPKVLKTTNGGIAWINVTLDSLPAGVNLYNLHFLTANTGYVVGNDGSRGVVYKTTDGGQTWIRKKYEGVGTSGWRSVRFLDANNGYVFGILGAMAITFNGGDDWNSMNNPLGSTGTIQAAHFLNASTGFAVTHTGRLLRTADGGASWNADSLANHSLNDIQFTDNMTGYIVGITASNGYSRLWKTTDGGANWSLRDPMGTGFPSRPTAIHFIAPDTGYAVGGSYVYKTVTGAVSLRPGADRMASGKGAFVRGDILSYELSIPGSVRVSLFDSRGRLVQRVFDGRRQAGSHDLKLPDTDLHGGPYFLEFRAGATRQTLHYMGR